jgi:hypothetical protein
MSARLLRLLGLVLASLVVLAVPAGACGGLVGENGTISLVRTTTLAAWNDGVERYVTSFQFTGEGEEVGSIVPLPGVPTDVERGGDWTLQRLRQEITPPSFAAARTESLAAADEAQVLLETKIDALDITILRGGGDAVGTWAIANGFLLTPDAPEVLDFYAERSPVFMAARFDASRAAELGQGSGDGTPIMLTIPTDEPWVPLRILGLGLDATEIVQADVFLLTPDRPQLLAGDGGLSLERSESASESLLADLRSDTGMEWVPQDMWLSHLALDTSAAELDYDLAISTHRGKVPSAVGAGGGRRGRPLPEETPLAAPTNGVSLDPGILRGIDGDGSWAIVIGLAVLVAGAGAFVLTSRVARRRAADARP